MANLDAFMIKIYLLISTRFNKVDALLRGLA